jgi:NADH pyrophosphatase NudC (nudix superfamily)
MFKKNFKFFSFYKRENFTFDKEKLFKDLKNSMFVVFDNDKPLLYFDKNNIDGRVELKNNFYDKIYENFEILHPIYVGTKNDKNIFTIDVQNINKEKFVDENNKFSNLRNFIFYSKYINDIKLVSHSRSLLNWYSTNKFCGTCGEKTLYKGKFIYCNTCKSEIFPRIDPAVISIFFLNKWLLNL